MAVLPKLISRFNAIPMKTIAGLIFFCINCELDPKLEMEMQETQNSQKNLERSIKLKNTVVPDFKTYCKTTVIKKVWDGYKDDIYINGIELRV